MTSISCEEMKKIDSYAINKMKIPSIVLMENAALKVIKNIDLKNIDKFTILCGVGNNGGDGLAVARHLIIKEKEVDLYVLGNLNKATEDFKVNLGILKNLNIKFNNIKDEKDLVDLKNSLLINDLTIDSIFGIGLTREVSGLYGESISLINEYSKKILSIDIPSGLDGDTGKTFGISVRADKTVTFHLAKKGLLKENNFIGELIVESIGIPKKATDIVLKNKNN